MVDDCPPFVVPADWPTERGIDPFAVDAPDCPPFVFPPDPLEPQKDRERPVTYYLRTTANSHSRRIGVGRGGLPFKETDRIVRKVIHQGGEALPLVRQTVKVEPAELSTTTAPMLIDPSLNLSMAEIEMIIQTSSSALTASLALRVPPTELTLLGWPVVRPEGRITTTPSMVYVVAATSTVIATE